MIKLAQYIFLFIFSFVQCKNYLLIVSFDGFRYDYLDKVDTPIFDSLVSAGSYSKNVKTVFPSLTFPSHYTIATGSYPNKHKILANKFYNKDIDRYYDYHDKHSVQNGEFYGSEPIWVTAEKQGIKSATFFWIGSEAQINGYRPSIYKEYDSSFSFSSRIDSVRSWLDKPENSRPQLVMLYFSEPDYTGHKYGPNSREVKSSIKEADRTLGYLVESLKTLSIKDSIDLIILSDHGMTTSGPDKIVILDNFIDTSPFYFWMKGSVLSIDRKNKKNHLGKSILNQLGLVPNVSFYTAESIPKRYHFFNSSFPDILLVADEGYYISPEQKNYDARGMHGYDPDLSSMKTIFIASGPNIKENNKIGEFETIHMYPLFCKLLNIEPNKDVDGGADGQLDVLEGIIKK